MSEPSAVLSTMRQWIELVLPIPVIYAGDPEPSAPRPNTADADRTYAAIEIPEDSTNTSTPEARTTDTAGSVDPAKVIQVRSEASQGSLSVEIYGPGAVDYARTLRRSITRQDVIDLLTAAGDYSILKAGDVSDEPLLRDAVREPNASISFDVQWVESDNYETEAVNSIVTTVEIEQE